VEIMDLPLQEAQPEAIAEENETAATENDFSIPEPAAIPDEGEISGVETAPASENGESAVPDVTIKVKFNKQERTYTAEEAAPLVEMGLKWESFRPQYEKLRYLASINEKSVGELIDGLIEESDSRLYSRIMEKTGGDEAEAARIFEKEKKELEKRLEQLAQREVESERQTMLEEKEEIEQRLANEFLLLAEEFSGRFNSFADVPEAVVDCAVNENISLFDAYLRYQHREAKKVEAERVRQMELSARSAGSLSDFGFPPGYELDEFEQAFYKALQ